MSSIKKNKLLIKKINGNISNKIDGVFRTVRNNGRSKTLSLSFKKLISSNKFIIIEIEKKTKETLRKLFR